MGCMERALNQLVVKSELMELIGFGCVLDRPEAAEGWRPAWRTAVSTGYSEQIEVFLKFWDTHPDFESSLLRIYNCP